MRNLAEGFAEIVPIRPGHGSLHTPPPALANVAGERKTDPGTERLIADLRICGFLWNDNPNDEVGQR